MPILIGCCPKNGKALSGKKIKNILETKVIMKTILRDIIRMFIERITKKTCDRCKYYTDGFLCGNYSKYIECTSSIYPKGFESKEE